MKPVYIFDLDGTLADSSHRHRYIAGDNKDFPTFHSLTENDSPIAPAIKTLRMLRKAGAEIWVWSGRGEEARLRTLAWMERNKCLPDEIRMRRTGDNRASHDIKHEWLMSLSPWDVTRVLCVFENSHKNVEMFRKAGVACYEVA